MGRRYKHRQRWSWLDRVRLHFYVWRGLTPYQCGELLGRTSGAILEKAADLGLRFAPERS